MLLNFAQGENSPASALENIDGRNVNNNATTLRAGLFQKDRPSAISVAVRKDSLTVTCDGREIIHWTGDPSRLSLSDYWKTPDDEALRLPIPPSRACSHRGDGASDPTGVPVASQHPLRVMNWLGTGRPRAESANQARPAWN